MSDIPMDEKALDTARLDALEAAMRKPGGLLLHNETSPTGRLGLGLMQRRSLREAIDTAYGPFAALPPVVLPSREAVEAAVREYGQAMIAAEDFDWHDQHRNGIAISTYDALLALLVPTEN